MELEEIRCFKVEEMKCLKVEEMRCFDNTFGDIRQLFDLVSPSLQGYFNMTQTN
jgi:maltooligosyltrehalose synthase